MKSRSDVGKVMDMIHAYRQTCLVVAGVETGVFERLARGPLTVGELARELELHESSLQRYLSALESIGLVRWEQSKVALRGPGKVLGEETFGGTLRAWSRLISGEYMAAWGDLGNTLRTGEVAFERIFGCNAWQHREQNPELNEAFQTVTSAERNRAIKGILRAYDFSLVETLVDVGGGEGELLLGLLEELPRAQGVLFDLPHVVEGLDLGGRCRVESGSFLEAIPPGHDLYLLKHVLHNWSDDDAVKILKVCAEALRPETTLLVLEHLLPCEPPTPAELSYLDLHMMAVLGGRERSLAEYEGLLKAAGLRLQRVVGTRIGVPDILEVMLK